MAPSSQQGPLFHVSSETAYDLGEPREDERPVEIWGDAVEMSLTLWLGNSMLERFNLMPLAPVLQEKLWAPVENHVIAEQVVS